MATSERRADKPFGKLVFQLLDACLKLRDERLQACDGGLLLCDNGKEFGFACGIHALVYPTKSQIMLGSYDRSRQIGILGFTLEQGARGIPLADYIAAVAKQANRYSPELIPLSDFMKLLRGINIFP
jgi:hypothetical protein